MRFNSNLNNLVDNGDLNNYVNLVAKFSIIKNF